MPGTWLPCLYRDSPGAGRAAPLWCFCPILQARRWLYAAAVACVLHASMNVDTVWDYITCFRIPTGSDLSGLVRLFVVLFCLLASMVVRFCCRCFLLGCSMVVCLLFKWPAFR